LSIINAIFVGTMDEEKADAVQLTSM